MPLIIQGLTRSARKNLTLCERPHHRPQCRARCRKSRFTAAADSRHLRVAGQLLQQQAVHRSLCDQPVALQPIRHPRQVWLQPKRQSVALMMSLRCGQQAAISKIMPAVNRCQQRTGVTNNDSFLPFIHKG